MIRPKPGKIRISLAHSHPVTKPLEKSHSIGEIGLEMAMPKHSETKRVYVVETPEGQMALFPSSRGPSQDLSHVSAPERARVTHSLEIVGAGPNSPPKLVRWMGHTTDGKVITNHAISQFKYGEIGEGTTKLNLEKPRKGRGYVNLKINSVP
jgi:hypothetical protein